MTLCNDEENTRRLNIWNFIMLYQSYLKSEQDMFFFSPKRKHFFFWNFENALKFLFFKVGSSGFQVLFLSSWNVHFRCLLGSGRPWGWHSNDSIVVYWPPFSSRGRAEPKRHRKWTFEDETNKTWKLELPTLKTNRVFWNFKNKIKIRNPVFCSFFL